jgi:hypothetical protein
LTRSRPEESDKRKVEARRMNERCLEWDCLVLLLHETKKRMRFIGRRDKMSV